MFPVFGGISGSTRTMLKEVATAVAAVYDRRTCGLAISAVIDRRYRLQLARDELLQLYDIGCEFADSFTRFFVGHRVVV